jgi:hypothetical protein
MAGPYRKSMLPARAAASWGGRSPAGAPGRLARGLVAACLVLPSTGARASLARASLARAFGVLLVAAVAVLAASGEARATETGAPVPAPPSVRRSGIVVGISSGLALSRVSGYRNDVAEIDLPEFEVDTGTGVNRGTALWLGGALSDWLTLSFGFSGGSYESRGLSTSGSILHLRADLFPLFWRGGLWQDLGVSLLAGTGNVSVERGAERVAEGEATSAVGAAVFFEPIRFWQCSTGPDLSYAHQFSRSISTHQFVIGWRLVLYGGP